MKMLRKGVVAGVSLLLAAQAHSSLNFEQILTDAQKQIESAQHMQQVKVDAVAIDYKLELGGSSDHRFASKTNGRSITSWETIDTVNGTLVKVVFDTFVLPKGAYVEVSSVDGNEVYRYGKTERDAFTFDAAEGQDGKTSFAAMSITGSRAKLRLVLEQGVKWNPRVHKVSIQKIFKGLSQDEAKGYQSEILSNFDRSVGIESTCGILDRSDAKCWENSNPVEYERSRPTAHLRYTKNGQGYVCTAWRVGPDNRVFTNQHCIENATVANTAEVWFNYQAASCGSSSNTTPTKVTINQVLSLDSNLDYTLFTVNNFSAVQSFGYYGLDVREPNLEEVIYIPQHPGGQPKQLAITSDQNTGNICRIDSTGLYGDRDAGYYCDTIGGSSGSPVLARSSNDVIAIHHFGGCMNTGVKMTKIWPQVSQHFNNQIPDGDDDGSTNPDPGDTYTGYLNDGAQAFEPDGSYFQYGGGTINLSLTGPSSGDFDLALWKWINGAWEEVDSSTSSDSTESINYQASSGYYTVRVYSYDGAGNYELTINK